MVNFRLDLFYVLPTWLMRELKGGVYFPRGLPRKALAEVQMDMVWCQYQDLSAIIKHI